MQSTLDGEATTYHYDEAGLLTHINGPNGTIDYTWDDNQNLVATSAGDTYTWTSTNMMATATVGPITETYTYDASGLRVAVDGDDWLWDRLGGLPTLVDDGTTSYFGSMAAATGGDTTWNLTDRLGSVRAITDPNAQVAGTADYYAYGSIRDLDGPQGALGYTGQYQDPTGLVHLRARQYDPALGRFLSADSVQPNAPGTQGFNLHGYTGSTPTFTADPSGHSVLPGYASRVAGSIDGATEVVLGSQALSDSLACAAGGLALQEPPVGATSGTGALIGSAGVRVFRHNPPIPSGVDPWRIDPGGWGRAWERNARFAAGLPLVFLGFSLMAVGAYLLVDECG